VLLTGMALFVFTAQAGEMDGPQVMEIKQADILLGAADGAVPPSDAEDWHPVTLPDDWQVRRPEVTGVAWYRIRLDLPEPPLRGQAIFIKWLRGFGTCFVNGVDVGRFGEVTTGDRSILYEFSPGLLHAGTNTLHVKLAVDHLGELASVQVGDRPALVGIYEREFFVRVTLPQFCMLLSAGLGLMTFVIWLGRRHDAMFGWFTVAALSFAVYVAPGLPTWMPHWVIPSLVSAPMTASLSIYCLRFAGWRWPRFEALLWGLSAIAPLSNVIYFIWDVDFIPGDAGRYLLLALYTLPLPLTVFIGWRLRSWESVALALGHLSNIVMLSMGGKMHGIDFSILHFMPVCLVMAFILTRRFVRSLNEAEMLNAQLAARVEAKRQELELNYKRLGELEMQQAVVAERGRLMRDMHDGIGGQLISTLSLVEAGEASPDKVAAALRECIDDLRLAIDSLEPTEDDLAPVLGNLRYRVEPRLKARGIDLDWHVSEMPRLASMTPQNVLHVLRILQEAFTNVLKHAGARHIFVATRCEGDRLLIDVRDDGRGLTDDSSKAGGRGLANMRQRAHALGGDLIVQANARGTTVTLGLPLAPAQAA
jgi:signal transduction histidine kinase